MTTEQPTWIIMPVVNGPEITEAAIADCLNQSVPTRVLVILQGVAGPFRERLEQIAEGEPRLLVWTHDPCLPSLSATWNRALQYVWETGGEIAWVCNNDIRVHPLMLANLQTMIEKYGGWFVSGVGVTEAQFAEFQKLQHPYEISEVVWDVPGECFQKGGPDFSCFLISKTGHEKYPFDEDIIPLFTEDLDCHRRYLLGGDGDRIFSINLPYHHIGGGSQTLKSLSPEARAKKERQIDGARAYYQRKWGGSVNSERYTIPFDVASAQDGVTTPELQAVGREAAHVPTDEAEIQF